METQIMSKHEETSMYGIKITYSWGDEEDIHGKYNTKEEAFREACTLAAKEAYVQNEEFIPEHDNCTVTFNASEYQIVLYYAYDNSYCYYNIEKTKEKTK